LPDSVALATDPSTAVTTSTAVRAPEVVGVNPTRTTQAPLSGTVWFVHASDWMAKSPGCVPASTAVLMFIGPTPTLRTTTDSTSPPMPTSASAYVTVGGSLVSFGTPPLPETTAATLTAPMPRSVTMSCALVDPSWATVTTTEMVHESPAGTATPAKHVPPETATSEDVVEMLAGMNAPGPAFVSVVVRSDWALTNVVPTSTLWRRTTGVAGERHDLRRHVADHRGTEHCRRVGGDDHAATVLAERRPTGDDRGGPLPTSFEGADRGGALVDVGDDERSGVADGARCEVRGLRDVAGEATTEREDRCGAVAVAQRTARRGDRADGRGTLLVEHTVLVRVTVEHEDVRRAVACAVQRAGRIEARTGDEQHLAPVVADSGLRSTVVQWRAHLRPRRRAEAIHRVGPTGRPGTWPDRQGSARRPTRAWRGRRGSPT
jgi:hypothetical protein